ncbi:MAG: malonyl-CoA decarboxylase family protein [Rubrivivax sp.]
MLERRRDGEPGELRRLCQDSARLLSTRGDAGGLRLAAGLVARLNAADAGTLGGYFDYLSRALNPDPAAVLRAAQAYAATPGPDGLAGLADAAEPPRQELLRRLNRTPGGTAAIVRMRRTLLTGLRANPAWQALEADLQHLLNSWFNPGFLEMRQVDWDAPARLLEKLIEHEAVHAIDGWEDLRRRLQPDRRCFAFFHPQLPDEPLIFVEVALGPTMPDAIGPLVDKRAAPLPVSDFRVAAFYSISNCEPGLRGVSLGNFLIKRVAIELQHQLPKVRRFCTLSPIPGLATWLQRGPDFAALPGLKRGRAALLHAEVERLAARTGGWSALQTAVGWATLSDADHAALQRLAATWLALCSPLRGGDPVARFHLDNGARLERLNPGANRAPAGLRQSFGLMVNYLYDLDRIEAHHSQFRAGRVACSRAVQSLL